MFQHTRLLGGVITATAIFWVVDMPSTVRVKAGILRLLPLPPETMNSSIRAICSGAYTSSAANHCYQSFYSAEAERRIAQDRRCEQMKKEVQDETEWIRNAPEPGDRSRETAYLYIGKDSHASKYGLLTFWPKDCHFTAFVDGDFKIMTFKD